MHLRTARAHPAAVVKRQQSRDAAALLPTLLHLDERGYRLFLLFHAAIARHRPEGLGRLLDEDVAEAASALAATLETAAKGVLYDHRPSTLPAQRLVNDLRAVLQEVREHARVSDTDAAAALRAIEHGAKEIGRRVGDERTGYLELMARLLKSAAASAEAGTHAPARSIILP